MPQAKPIDPLWFAREVVGRQGFPGNAETSILAHGLLEAHAENERLRPIVESVRDADGNWDWTKMRLEARYALEARNEEPAVEPLEESDALDRAYQARDDWKQEAERLKEMVDRSELREMAMANELCVEEEKRRYLKSVLRYYAREQNYTRGHIRRERGARARRALA